MRVLANWLSETMIAECAKFNISNITRILSPLYLSEFVQTPPLNTKDKFLICKDLSENKLKFITINGEELSSLLETIIEENLYSSVASNNIKLKEDFSNWDKNNLTSILEKVKLVENKFNYFYQIEQLKEYPVLINTESAFVEEEDDSELPIKDGKHTLNYLLNKVKELHRPDVFDITRNFAFTRKRIDLRVTTEEKLAFQVLRNQFEVNSILAKHIAIAATCDLLVVKNEEEYSQFAHILSALEADTKIILEKEFFHQYNKITDTFSESKLTFVQKLLSLTRNKNWIEIHENHFKLNIEEPFLGFFNQAIFIKNADKDNQLILSNINGGLIPPEKKAVEDYINSFLSNELIDKANWRIKNLHITFDPSKGGKLIVNFS